MGPTPPGPPESPHDEPRPEFHARQETPESGIGTDKNNGNSRGGERDVDEDADDEDEDGPDADGEENPRPLRTYAAYPEYQDDERNSPDDERNSPDDETNSPDESPVGDFLDDETDQKHKKRQYYADYDDDDNDVRPFQSVVQLTDFE